MLFFLGSEKVSRYSQNAGFAFKNSKFSWGACPLLGLACNEGLTQGTWALTFDSGYHFFKSMGPGGYY